MDSEQYCRTEQSSSHATAPDHTWQGWLRNLRRTHLAVSLAALALCLAVGLCLPRNQAASLILKLDFVTTGNALLTPQQYATTNSSGWSPITTEANFVCSDLCLRLAHQRLGKPSPTAEALAAARDRLDWAWVPQGIRLQAKATTRSDAAALVRAVAEVYREERNRLLPLPPDCRALSISIVESPWTLSSLAWLRERLRPGFGALLLVAATATLLLRTALTTSSPVPNTFLFWFLALFGVAALASPLPLGVASAGAILLAFLLAGANECLTWGLSLHPPVPPKYLRYAFLGGSTIVVGGGLLMFALSDAPNDTTTRVRISLAPPGTTTELPVTYSSRLLATECALIQGRHIATAALRMSASKTPLRTSRPGFMPLSAGGQTQLPPDLDQHPFQADIGNDRMYHQSSPRSTITPQSFLPDWFQIEDLVMPRVTASPVRDTSLIDISYTGEKLGAPSLSAVDIAEAYRAYWSTRSETNLARKITITLVNWSNSPRRHRELSWSAHASIAIRCLRMAVLGLLGALSLALLARKPARHHYLALVALCYLSLLGAIALPQTWAASARRATCHIRVWPSATTSAVPATNAQPTRAAALLDVICRAAMSEPVLAKTAEELALKPVFMKGGPTQWTPMSHPEKLLTLQRRLQAVPSRDSYAIALAASDPSPKHAAEIANAAATALLLHGATPAKTELEMLEPATALASRKPQSLPLHICLHVGLEYLLPFMVGAGIGYIGLVFEKSRRPKRRTLPTNPHD